MTTSKQPDLVVLIRLLHDDLSAAEGAAVRRRLADSREFATRYRTLNSAISESLNADALLSGLDHIDPEQIAQFVDARMEVGDSDRFEAVCWQSTAALREVAAAWRAKQQSPALELSPAANLSDRLQNLIARRLDESERIPRSANAQTDPAATIGPGPAQPESIQFRGRSPRSPRRSSRSLLTALVVPGIIGAVVTAVFFGSRLFNGSESPDKSSQDQVADTSRQDIAHSPREQLSEPDSPPDAPQVDDSGGSGTIELPAPRSNDSMTPDRSNAVVDTPPVAPDPSLPDMQPRPQTPQPDPPRPTRRRVALISEWRKISGVVAMNSANAPQWRGVRNETARQALRDDASDGFITLADGMATAELANGEQLTIGSDTFLRAIGSVSNDDASDLAGELTLEYGRLAVTNLTDQRSVRVLAGTAVFVVQAIGSEVDFTVEQSFGAIVFAIQKGTVQINQQRASKDSWLQFESGSLTRLPPRARAFEWMKGPPVASPLSAGLQQSLNTSDNFVADTRALMTSRDRRIATYAARALIDLADARDTSVLPAGLIQAAVNSRTELQREALVRWILSSLERRPERADAIWDAVLTHGQAGSPALNTRSRDQLRELYEAAVRRDAADLDLMAKLAQRLRPTNHIFVRQSAKFFLQQILGTDLAEYDAANPSARALTSVTTKLRRWQQEHQPR